MMWNYQRELLNFTVRMRKKTPGFVKQSLVRSYITFENNGVIKASKKKYHINFMIYIITALLFVNYHYVDSTTVIYNAQLPAEPFYYISYNFCIATCHCWFYIDTLCIQLNKKDFVISFDRVIGKNTIYKLKSLVLNFSTVDL